MRVEPMYTRSALSYRFREKPFFRLSYRTIGFASGAIDCLVILVAGSVGHLFYELACRSKPSDLAVSLGVGVLACVVHVPIAQAWGQYRLSVLTTPLRHMRRIIVIALMVGLSVTAVLFLLKAGSSFSRGAMLSFLVIQCSCLIAARLAQGLVLRRLMVRGAIDGQPVFLVGDAAELGRLSATALLFHFGQREVGRMVLSDDEHEATTVRRAVEIARQCDATAFSLAMDWSDASRLGVVDQSLRASPLAVQLLPDYRARAVLARHARDSMARSMMVVLQRAPLTWLELTAKCLFDRLLAGIALLLLSPLLLAVAIIVKLDSPGPAIFRQQRRGFNQKPFTIYKFRTMSVQENGGVVRQASRNDQRVTKIGRILRRSSIDEIPQLLNVLQGNMSLVGPRPHAVAHDDHYGQRIDTYCQRHHVKPGITGWAQVNGVRGETAKIQDMHARVELDVWYVNNWSPILDIAILFRTCFAVFRHDAY